MTLKGSLLLVALLLFFGGYAAKVAIHDANSHRENTAVVDAQSLLAFVGFARDFKEAGGTFAAGISSGASVNAPAWFKQASHFHVLSAGGSEYVYAVYGSAAESARALKAVDESARWDSESLLVGRKQGGRLLTLRANGQVPSTLPAAIPENAVVVPLTI